MRLVLLVIAATRSLPRRGRTIGGAIGNLVDQATKNLCCGQNDCKEVPASDAIQPGCGPPVAF